MFSFDLQGSENLIKTYRQSESLLIKPTILVMAAIYIPVWFMFQYGVITKLAWLLAIWTLGVLIYAVNKYILWLVTTYLITDRRVVAITYSSLAKRQTEELTLKGITAIRQKSAGVFGHLFKYGTLEVESGGTPVIFKNVSNPKQVKELILKYTS